MYVLFHLGVQFCGLGYQLIRYTQTGHCKVIASKSANVVWQRCFTVQRILVGSTLFDHFMQTTTDIVEFEVRASDGASILLVSRIVFSIDALVIGKIDVVALGVRIYW